MKKITITGTKGKTTVTNVVSFVLQKSGNNVLHVNTTGHFVNGQRKSTLEESKNIWGLVPSVSPGRFLGEFLTNPTLKNKGVAVMEASLGSSQLAGLGYRSHDVGVFLNVYEDHLGSSSRLKSKSDLAKAKEFIFSRLERNGYVIYNSDDKLVVRSLRVVPSHLGITQIACGIDFKYIDINSYLAHGGDALTAKDGKIVLLTKNSQKVLVDLNKIPWTFNARYLPSVWNIMMSVAAVYAFSDKKWDDSLKKAVESYRLDKYGGRLTLLKGSNGCLVLADYAHEEKSLVEIAKLAKSLVINDGKVIGVVRLANDRTEQLIEKTGKSVGKAYDKCIVYDKIDGYYRKPRIVRSQNFPEVVGRISSLYAKAIKSTNNSVERIIREDKAAKRASDIAGKNDIVVYIVNDNIERSIGFIKKYFRAEFV